MKLKVLDFDIENRPLSYWYDGQCTAQITAIASCWIDRPRSMRCEALTLDPDSYAQMLDAFLVRYAEADMVTGHFITQHDLPIISGALLDLGRPPLGEKLVSDTKTHLKKRKDIPASQETLGAMLKLDHPKVLMNQVKWREANRLTPAGIRLTRKRCIGDVRQHMDMRARLIDLEWLDRPKMWRP